MIELPMVPDGPMRGDEEQTVLGLRYCHQQVITLAQQMFAASTQIRALTAALYDRGLIDGEELAARQQAEEPDLVDLYQQLHVGVRIDDKVPDKYAIPEDALPAIDCADRYHLCHAACCSLRFALSRQDLDEGTVRWELGQPYLNRQERDGYCTHLERGTHRCSVYASRPGICRTYDCREDTRIWLDFEARLPNPAVDALVEAGTPDPQAAPVRGITSSGARGNEMARPIPPIPTTFAEGSL